jgi:hypothetical protein
VNSAAALLKDRSQLYLMRLAHRVEQDVTRENATAEERAHALELGIASFSQVNALLKATLDTKDLDSFATVERQWASMFAEEEWLLDDDYDPRLEHDQEWAARVVGVRRLVRYRGTLRLGLAMWAAHLQATGDGESPDGMRVDALRILAGRFEGVEDLLDTYERASEREVEEDRLPWTDWFLSELPAEVSHIIPTQSELLFTTVLLTVVISDGEERSLSPRAWLKWRDDELNAAFAKLEEQAARWSVVILAPSLDTGLEAKDQGSLRWWYSRVGAVRSMFARLRADSEADEELKLRGAPLDQERVKGFRTHLLKSTANARLLRDVFIRQAEVEFLDRPPEGHVDMTSTSWMPKSFFTPDSRLVGLEMVAGDLSRVTSRTEVDQLITALPTGEPPMVEEPLTATVEAVIAAMRLSGRSPSLIVIPLGWDLRRALGLTRQGSLEAAYPMVPLARRRDFEGVFDGVPVIDFPQVPEDRLWVLDLAAALRFREWPSDDSSGIRFELKTFDEQQAAAMLAEHPEVRGEGRSFEEAIHEIQDRVLLTLTICWEIRPVNQAAAAMVEVPRALRRKKS